MREKIVLEPWYFWTLKRPLIKLIGILCLKLLTNLILVKISKSELKFYTQIQNVQLKIMAVFLIDLQLREVSDKDVL